ncbi:response regulator transcription factor [Pseudomonas syringae pv. tagetis]|uniref:DNA-binding response regulator, LuxR family n=2 Tax=Pseudomonas syringae group genomosp. 7 TaxID=251699 RepID=A0A0Q0C9D6_9PSED|nr:response regulator transcription factor [Pseudomonas syringae group genomosp. 7]KPX47345.1 DNA-binding response regulator, LuxR family [Pseudomonas syringae pv. helianthi]KPY88114.1 DNA-binding response regulator, LuxR family [Pseudomonas syringae pv. tagetis]RMR08065.1 DNA-binding response regulator, LuxR family [Pseudomonas syringae pv. helianthi]RMW07665.1 DNA-binding response regulator, LuxR family [Pseudomonas syringae pv. tagetis]RMW17233.1 DNA-binding response regulator, LuxR family 
MTCNLLLVDDHSLIRAGVRALVADMPGYAILGEAADGAQLSSLAQRLKPDIILLDIWMKSVDGLEALEHLLTVQPHCKVLILSMHTDPDMIMRALDIGARGYLLKDTTATELEQALEALRNNERYLSPAIAHTVIERALRGTRSDRARAAKERYNLTARQLEILRLIVRGKSTREIADGLGLSIKTVETHRSQIMKRLQIFDVAGLVLFCVRERIISLDD